MVTHAELMNISAGWIRVLNIMNELESTPRDFGTGDLLHCSEIHTLMAIGKNPDVNVTNLATFLGISKSAISQMITRLARKGLVERYKCPENEKETKLCLTPRGTIAFLGHEQHHAIIFTRMQEKLGFMTDEQYEFLIRVFNAIEETAKEFTDRKT